MSDLFLPIVLGLVILIVNLWMTANEIQSLKDRVRELELRSVKPIKEDAAK